MCEETSVLGGYFILMMYLLCRYDVRPAVYDVCLTANDVFLAEKLKVCYASIILEYESFVPSGRFFVDRIHIN